MPETAKNIFNYQNETTMKLSASSKIVLQKRYLKKNELGEAIETPEDMLWRVACNIAETEKKYGKDQNHTQNLAIDFYKMMCSTDFLPNSPTLMNAGRDLQQLSACFVLPVEDSMDSIFEAIKQTAIIHKTGGGTGFSFSRLRPANDPVASTGGIASGPLSFMKVFNATTDVVKQGGARRGANMGILRVDHPDIHQFITAKDDNTSLVNFNLSVALTDDFMKALEEGKTYPLINPKTGKTVKKEKAREVFDLIIEKAWRSGEPGVIFIDRINASNPTPHIGKIESTNPCGEQPLLAYESCNLGSINLSNMVIEKEGKKTIDKEHLKKTINLAIRFLDNVIDANRYPIPEIEKISRGNRKIGLGVMGFADMLIKLGIPYNCEKALAIAEETMEFIEKEALDTSEKLSEERGAFPNFPGSIYDKEGGRKLRNATVTTIAPTGSISIIAGCSSGIEPLFALSYIREILDGEKLLEVHEDFSETLKVKGLYNEDLMKKIAKRGSIASINEIDSEIKELFVVSHDIAPEWHVKMQAAFQKYTDNAVSKTVNFPMHATREDIRAAFLGAYHEGCKGITVYRYGSRETQVLNIQNEDKNSAKKISERLSESRKIIPRPRPAVTEGRTEKVAIGCGNIYVTVNSDDINICEVFTQTGKGGGCPSQSEAVGRLVSMALRSDIDPTSIINQLKGIRCVSCTRRQNVKVLSCPDAISRVMEKSLRGNTEPINGHSHKCCNHDCSGDSSQEEEPYQMPFCCPECGHSIEVEGRCYSCRSCGYSKCG